MIWEDEHRPNDYYTRFWKEPIVTLSKELSQHSPEETVEDSDQSQSVRIAGKLVEI
jgi:hypothetical protein